MSTLNVPANYATVQAAVIAARTGDTVLLAPGSYREEVTTKAGQPGVILEGPGATLAGRITLVKPGWTVRNLKIGGWTQWRNYLGLLEVAPGAHQTTLENLVIDATETIYTAGIFFTTGGLSPGPFPPELPCDCKVLNCDITGIKGHVGINMMGSRNVMEGTRIHDCIQSDFIRLFGDGNRIIRNVFDGNKFAPPGESVGFHADFIQTFGTNGFGSRNHIIDGNVISNIEGQITQFEENNLAGTSSMGNWTFRNNLFHDITLGCSTTLSNCKWLNNTFVRCCTNGGHVLNFGNGPRGFSNGMKIFNNVFLDCGRMTSVEEGWYGDGTIPDYIPQYGMVEYEADYNYYGKGPEFKPARTDSAQPKFRWSEVHGVNGGDPKFTDGYHLTPESILVGRATAQDTYLTDFDGVVRGSAWDIGAFEAVASAPPTEPGPEPGPSPLELPAMTRAQRDLVEATDGMMIYQTDRTPGAREYRSGAWGMTAVTADP